MIFKTRTLKVAFILASFTLSIEARSKSSCSITEPSSGRVWSLIDFSAHNKAYTNDWNKVIGWADLMNEELLCGHDDWQVASISDYRALRSSDIKSIVFSEGPDYYWSRNEINKWVASYFDYHDGFATSGAKTGKKWASGLNENENIKFSALLVRKATKH